MLLFHMLLKYILVINFQYSKSIILDFRTNSFFKNLVLDSKITLLEHKSKIYVLYCDMLSIMVIFALN